MSPDRETAAAMYETAIQMEIANVPSRARIISGLAGRDVACWCHLCPEHEDGLPAGVICLDCQPCHGDVLLKIANESS